MAIHVTPVLYEALGLHKNLVRAIELILVWDFSIYFIMNELLRSDKPVKINFHPAEAVTEFGEGKKVPQAAAEEAMHFPSAANDVVDYENSMLLHFHLNLSAV